MKQWYLWFQDTCHVAKSKLVGVEMDAQQIQNNANFKECSEKSTQRTLNIFVIFYSDE